MFNFELISKIFLNYRMGNDFNFDLLKSALFYISIVSVLILALIFFVFRELAELKKGPYNTLFLLSIVSREKIE